MYLFLNVSSSVSEEGGNITPISHITINNKNYYITGHTQVPHQLMYPFTYNISTS